LSEEVLEKRKEFFVESLNEVWNSLDKAWKLLINVNSQLRVENPYSPTIVLIENLIIETRNLKKQIDNTLELFEKEKV